MCRPIAHAVRYANGFDVLGVQSGWQIESGALDKPHTGVYFFDRPMRPTAGDSLRVRLPNNVIGCNPCDDFAARAAGSIATAMLPNDLATSLDDSQVARASYLRSTAWNASAFDRIKSLEADILECRDGKTPVMVTEQTDKPLTIRRAAARPLDG